MNQDMTRAHRGRALGLPPSLAGLLWVLAAGSGCNDVLGVETLPGAEPREVDEEIDEGLWPTGDGACKSCVEQSQCVAQTEACAASAECRAVYACLQSSEPPIDPGDMFRCRVGDWGTLSRDLLFCAAGCSVCGLNEDMSCAGEWGYPAAGTGEQLTVEIALLEPYMSESTPVAGARVTPCSPAVPGCQPVGMPVLSDADGIVSLPVIQGYPGFFEISADGFGLLYLYPQQYHVFWETRTPLGMWSQEIVAAIGGFEGLRPDLGMLVPSMGSCYNPLQTSLPVVYSIEEAKTDDTFEATLNGIQFIFNLEPGYWELTAEVAGQTTRRTIQIAPGVSSLVRMLPPELP